MSFSQGRERSSLLEALQRASTLTLLAVFLFGFRSVPHSLICTFVDKKGTPLESVETRLLPLDREDEKAKREEYRKSDPEGRLEYSDLQPGSYLFQAQLKGFMPLRMIVQMPAAEQLHRVLLRKKEFDASEKTALESLNSQDFEKAVQGLETLAGHYPGDATLHDHLARAYAGMLDEKKALAAADKAANLDPGFSSTRNEVRKLMLRTSGQNALRERDFKTAAERFNALKELDPQNPAAYEGLALAYGHQGEIGKAFHAIGRALELDPDNAALKKIEAVLEANR